MPTTHALAKVLLERKDVPIVLFLGTEPDKDNSDTPLAVTGKFSVIYSEEESRAMIVPYIPKPSSQDIKYIIESVFTSKELKAARNDKSKAELSGRSVKDVLLENYMTPKKMARIDKLTDSENHAGYWAYALVAYFDGVFK